MANITSYLAMIMGGQWKVPPRLVLMNEKPDPVRMYLRSCGIYANGSVAANPPVVFIGDETRAHKKLDPVQMYWQSREIYENECM